MSSIALISGGSGFLGAHLTTRLRGEGWDVHISSRSPGAGMNDCSWHTCDLVDFASAEQLLDTVKPDVIFHLAGASSAKTDLDLVLPTFHSHATSSINLLTLIQTRSVRRLVITGSLLETREHVPSSPYSAAKSVARLYAQMFHFLYGTPVVIVRPFMTFGPGQNVEKVLPYVIRCFDEGMRPKLSSGTWRADWIYVADVIEGIFRAGTVGGIDGQAIDLGRGELTSLKEMVFRIRRIMCSRVEPEFSKKQDRPDEPERVADTPLAEKLIGWVPNVPLEEGLRRTIDSYRSKAKRQ